MDAASEELRNNLNNITAMMRREIDRVDASIKALNVLRAAYVAVIVSTETFFAGIQSGELVMPTLASTEEQPETTIEITAAPPGPATTKITSEHQWRILQRLMAGRDRFTSTEAGEALEASLGRKIANRPQTVRNNMERHKDVFRRNDDGTWTVISNEKEAPEETS